MKNYKPLLKLARQAIESELNNTELKVPSSIKKEFSCKKACFVTLTYKIDGRLKGCIGSLQARQELWKDVTENAKHAAFSDPRFFPLTKQELDKIKIEISVLSEPKKLECKNEKDLLNKINKKMGLILKKGFHSATFLPQVWEQLPDKKSFLQQLSFKAGLSSDAWKDAEFACYYVEKVEES